MHVLVVGSGIAGLTAAVRASRRHDVTLISKGALTDAATTAAQGGVAVALGADDTVLAHIEDTIVAGAASNNARAVEILCTDGPARVQDLIALGVPFDRTASRDSIDQYGDDFARGREAAHSRWRVLHADGDATGAAIENTLIGALQRQHVTVLERTCLIDLVVSDGRVTGADVLDLLGEPARINADAVILASGGAGHLYQHTTNPLVSTGDGQAAAWRAGAVLADLEFVQFHPTRLAVSGGGLISEAVRGEGAYLLDASGARFMADVHRDAELAPRDVVARGIAAAMREHDGAPVMLDATVIGADRLVSRFPGLTAATREFGFDWTREPVPVAPASHYAMGGVVTDAEGRTSIPGLIAVGEVACTGVHGANRLASNSLLEGLVFAVRAADSLERQGPAAPRLRGDRDLPVHAVASLAAARPVAEPDGEGTRSGRGVLRSHVHTIMEQHVGLLRDADGLRTARSALAAATAATGASVAALEDRNLLDLARLTALAAEARRESRGAHARTDYPDTDPSAPRSRAWVSAPGAFEPFHITASTEQVPA